ncbi:probable S-adenosylmethionine-dependent methyltransferase At5g37990 [Neltuma alba]|uniref:probable S-adenosylmethionine-dependent methyltransferase At5g37990 n=1 Tax=Neltuma alba TaxID=207710 RepID=UPI0010A30434|nr:probable S-adenosylmethionine-dependent methyltransferase At5g37990 [Prosopis alba]
MESENGTQSYEAFPMYGGQGQYSYAQNSNHQRKVADVTKHIIRDAILEMLDLETLLHDSSNIIRIADLGCSVGPNTFFIVQNIIDSVNLKSQSHQEHGFDSPEFQVFFNDHVGNDFNTLFKSLPMNKQYYAAAVPGSFHGRLFPESSIHVFNSTYALHWLSRVPKDIVDKNSPAYNKGKIYYTNEEKEVAEAYSAQFERDLESFLNSRALELVPGGIMTLTIFCVPPDSKNGFEVLVNVMGDVLVDMANKGLISHEMVDSFNIPIYTPASEEVRVLIEKNGKFKIEKSELLFRLFGDVNQQPNAQTICTQMRAVWEGLFKKHFEQDDVVDEIFIQYEKKLAETTLFPFSKPSYKQLGGLYVMRRTLV